MRLIDLNDDRHCYISNDGEYERWNIDTEVPTIDAVEVVRCKDCRKNPKIAWFECPMAGKSLVFDNGFCHMGERRRG